MKRATGNGQSECKKCKELGIYSRTWTSFLYEVPGYEGLYCYGHAEELEQEQEVE